MPYEAVSPSTGLNSPQQEVGDYPQLFLICKPFPYGFRRDAGSSITYRRPEQANTALYIERPLHQVTSMAIDSAYKTIQHEVGPHALHDVVDQSRFGGPPSRPVGTDKDVKHEERPCGCEAS